jgi:paraquat-inducible protein B
MAKEMSKTVIGAFVISAIALMVGGVLIFGGGQLFKKTNKYVLFFEGSVQGLTKGSPVVWRGVQIGSVQQIILLADQATMTIQIPVIIEIEPARFELKGETKKRDPKGNVAKLIKLGLRAKLASQSLVTGQLLIEMDLHPEIPARLVGSDFPYPEIPTIPSTLEQIAQTINELPIKQMFNKLENAIENVSGVLGDPALKDMVGSAREALESANHLFKQTEKLVANIDGQVVPLSDSIKKTAGNAQQLLQNVDGQVEPLASKIRATFAEATGALMEAKTALEGVSNLSAESSETAYRLGRALEELSRAARSFRVLADYLEQNPDALLRGKTTPGGK